MNKWKKQGHFDMGNCMGNQMQQFYDIFLGSPPWLLDFKSQIPVARRLKLKKIIAASDSPYNFPYKSDLAFFIFSFIHFSILKYCTTHSNCPYRIQFHMFHFQKILWLQLEHVESYEVCWFKFHMLNLQKRLWVQQELNESH